MPCNINYLNVTNSFYFNRMLQNDSKYLDAYIDCHSVLIGIRIEFPQLLNIIFVDYMLDSCKTNNHNFKKIRH